MNDYTLEIDWIHDAETLTNASDEYGPIPSIRLVLINEKGYKIQTIPCSEFASLKIETEPNTIIRDIALFSFSIHKHQLRTLSAVAYESVDSVEQLRERLMDIKSLPCFFGLFEIVVFLDTKPESCMKGKGGGGKKTRKQVRFHHSCTRRL